MRRRRAAVAAALLVTTTSLAACGDPSDPAAGGATSVQAWNDLSGLASAAPETTIVRTPVGSIASDDPTARIAWAFPAEGVEFIGVHDGTVYASTDTQVIAASLSDGTVLWRHAGDDYLSDGQSMIGMDDDDVWAITPNNANLRLDATTGHTVRRGPPMVGPPDGFVALDAPAPTEWTVENTDTGVRAVGTDGRVAWRLSIGDPSYAEGGPVIAAGGLTIVPAADGFVYAISAG